jgi:hypothetical protein
VLAAQAGTRVVVETRQCFGVTAAYENAHLCCFPYSLTAASPTTAIERVIDELKQHHQSIPILGNADEQIF